MSVDERRPGAELSPRLAAVAALVPAGSRLADVGTDHGLLPVHLLLSGRIRRAVAIERTATQLASASGLVERHGLRGLELRVGEGLDPLRAEDRLDVVVLAGMGGRTLKRILRPERLSVLRPSRLVVQPQTGVEEVRAHLDAAGWTLIAESAVEDRGRVYVVLAAEPGSDPALWEHPVLTRGDLLAAGPLLVRSGGEPVVAYWSRRLARLSALERDRSDPEVAQARRVLAVLRGVTP